jgi:hypothetical protein
MLLASSTEGQSPTSSSSSFSPSPPLPSAAGELGSVTRPEQKPLSTTAATCRNSALTLSILQSKLMAAASQMSLRSLRMLLIWRVVKIGGRHPVQESGCPHFFYRVNFITVKLGNDPNTRAVEARLIYSSKTTGAFLVPKDWQIFATYIDRLIALLAPQYYTKMVNNTFKLVLHITLLKTFNTSYYYFYSGTL